MADAYIWRDKLRLIGQLATEAFSIYLHKRILSLFFKILHGVFVEMLLDVILSNDRIPQSVAAHFYHRCFTGEYGSILGSEYLDSQIDELTSSILAEDLEGRVAKFAWFNTTLVGTSIGKLVDDTFYLWGVYVDPMYFRKGIGSLMLNALRAELPSGTIIEIQVLTSSKSALHFWAAMGFRASSTAMSEVFPGKMLEICYMKAIVGVTATS